MGHLALKTLQLGNAATLEGQFRKPSSRNASRLPLQRATVWEHLVSFQEAKSFKAAKGVQRRHPGVHTRGFNAALADVMVSLFFLDYRQVVDASSQR